MADEKLRYEDILDEKEVPAVAADQEGLIFFINKPFEREFGWRRKDLLDNALIKILPPYMRDAHNLGFSRFLATESPRIIGKKISLPVYCKNGNVREAIHFITAENRDGKWKFAALIDPTEEKYDRNQIEKS